MNARKPILIECSEDYVGLWSILRKVVRYDNVPITEGREKTLKLIEELLNSNLIQPGNFAENSNNFELWELSATDTIARIKAEWDALGRDPDIGEVVWFITTEKGNREVELLKRVECDRP